MHYLIDFCRIMFCSNNSKYLWSIVMFYKFFYNDDLEAVQNLYERRRAEKWFYIFLNNVIWIIYASSL